MTTTTTISTSKLRENMAEALDIAQGKHIVVVTRRGKPEKAIVDLDEYEDMLAASDPEYLESIRQAREEVSRGDVLTMDEVFGDL